MSETLLIEFDCLKCVFIRKLYIKNVYDISFTIRLMCCKWKYARIILNVSSMMLSYFIKIIRFDNQFPN